MMERFARSTTFARSNSVLARRSRVTTAMNARQTAAIRPQAARTVFSTRSVTTKVLARKTTIV